MRVLPTTLQEARSHLQRAKAVKASSFEYLLHRNCVAERPLADRSSSKLLVVDFNRQQPLSEPVIQDRVFRDLAQLLPRGSLLVRNASRVIRARLPLQKRTGGRAELLLLSPVENIEPCDALSNTRSRWRAFVGGKRIRDGDLLHGKDLDARIVERSGQMAVVDLEVHGHDSTSCLDLRSALATSGKTPLPPYIRRASDDADTTDYQTVFAQQEGSVAAPTAGLHMTNELENELKCIGVDSVDVTLHVGAGTFAPLGGELAGDHSMHVEHVHVTRQALKRIVSQVQSPGITIALGTTSVRTLESLYWLGVRRLHGSKCENVLGIPEIRQWEPYEYLDRLGADGLPSIDAALEAVLKSYPSKEGVVFKTKLLIVPGYPFHMYVEICAIPTQSNVSLSLDTGLRH